MKDFPWFNKYPAVVAKEITLYEYSSLVELFDKTCARYSGKIAFESMGARLTYAEVDKLAENFAAYLQQDLGLK